MFAVAETEEESAYKVLPGTGLVIGFQYKGKITRLGDTPQVLTASGITGLHDAYREFTNSPGTGTVLVYFRDIGAATFFGLPLHELFDSSVSLEHFVLRSELLLFEERLCEVQNDRERLELVEKFLLSRMKDTEPDSLVASALGLIYQNKGSIKIKELAAQLYTSQSPLEKRFRVIIGTSPKKFASIVRMKHLLNNPKKASLTEMGYDAGFYDQSHFIKVFKGFTGETPESFFSREQ
jgi:AraC-like DNA-binding protein